MVLAERLEGWRTALELVDEEPLYGVGLGTVSEATVSDGAGAGWARHEPLQVTAETGLTGGVLLLALLWWTLAWVARPGGGPGSIVAGIIVAGSVAHACLVPIWRDPAVPLALAALAGVASTRGGDPAWRLDALRERLTAGAAPAVDPAETGAGPADDQGGAATEADQRRSERGLA